MNKFEKFTQLHHESTPLILGNIWDVQSAVAFQAAGYKAIGTSSQALAIANGYQDGEQISFELLHALAKKVVGAVDIPFTVDIEGGYSRTPEGIIENIERLADLGVVGINLEDSIVSGGSRDLRDKEQFSELLTGIADHISRKGLGIFLNVRTDGFLLGLANALEETLGRIERYRHTGADGIFVPCVTAKSEILVVANSTTLPLNVMCMPGLPAFAELMDSGVKRISFGPFLFNRVYDGVKESASRVLEEQQFGSLFA